MSSAGNRPVDLPDEPDEVEFKPRVKWTGVFRQDRLLVMHRDAVLPDICVKTNVPAEGSSLKRKLAWHDPMFLFVLLAGPIPYVIVAAIMTKRATIYIGLSDELKRKRRRDILLAWVLVLICIGMFAFGVAWASSDSRYAWLIPIGIVLGIAAAMWGTYAARIVTPKRIDDDFVWIKGVHPDFIAQFPPFPKFPRDWTLHRLAEQGFQFSGAGNRGR